MCSLGGNTIFGEGLRSLVASSKCQGLMLVRFFLSKVDYTLCTFCNNAKSNKLGTSLGGKQHNKLTKKSGLTLGVRLGHSDQGFRHYSVENDRLRLTKNSSNCLRDARKPIAVTVRKLSV